MVCDGQVEDQAPTARCVVQVVPDLHVAAPLACAGTREEPGTLTQGGALFSLIPLVWE